MKDGPDGHPFREHAKHVVAGAAVFGLIFCIALGVDYAARELVARKIVESGSFLHWTLRIAKNVILLAEVVALVVLVCKTTWDFIKSRFK